MALNVYDPANLTSTPVAATTPAAGGWSFSQMLADPNFQLLLANMGKAADPEGAGGVIGGATANMISSKAAQTALEKRDAARQAQIKQLIDLHGGITPKDQPGINSIKRTPTGGLAFDLDLPPLDTRVGAGVGTVLAPGAQPVAQAPARTQPLIAPTTQQSPAAVAPSQPTMRTASTRRPELDEIIPFY